MKFYLNGAWQSRDDVIEVTNPYDGSVVDTVPKANEQDVELVLAGAVKGAAMMAETSGYDRFEILRRTTDLMQKNAEDLAVTLSREEGKTIGEARLEVDRACQTMELSGEEAKRLSGELLPLDGGKDVRDKIGFTMRVPCGVVLAIAPFNFPLNLVCHKIGPALAAGNAVILKPASDTPLVSLKLVELLLEAGLPPHAISCITGSGRSVGESLCQDARVRKISFTGSHEVGNRICQVAGMKKVTMELGSNCPMIVMPDADMELAVSAAAVSGYANAGQVCISTQRLILCDKIRDEFIHKLQSRIAGIATGNPLDDTTSMGPMVRESDATRVQNWVQEAVSQGARIIAGGNRDQCILEPTLLDNTSPDMKVNADEVFGPVVSILHASGIEEAIKAANNSRFGLGAGIFTKDIDHAMHFARYVQSGNIHINWSPLWRTDLMPYGGLKDSGIGKEGPKYAIDEMSEFKTIVIHSSFKPMA